MGQSAYRYLLVLMVCLVLLNNRCYAGEINDKGAPPPPVTKETLATKRKRKANEVLNKALVYLSYLNYSDRTYDRVLKGIDKYEPYRAKIIGRITISILQPFGVTIDRPQPEKISKVEKFANKVQFKTQEWTVRNELLFAPGELVDPVKFADTEKNIWERGTFKDLKILLEPVGESGDTINVQVIVQERFSWSISTSAQYNKAVVGVEFCNVAGMPQSLEQKMAFNYRKDNPYTVYGGYEYDNIRHSHIDVMAEYQYENLSKGADVALIRNFFSSTCRWAGYVQGGLYRDLGSLPNPYAAAIPTNIYYNWQDIWLATSMPFDEGLTGKNSALRWVVAGRLYRYQYLQRPYKISEDGSQIFLNHSYILGSVGLATWDYYVAQDVFSLHKSEYFSKGFNASLIFGLDNDEEYGQRFYSGVRLNCGNYFHGFGYLNSRISYGGFSGQSGYNQLLLKISQRIFSETVQLGPKMRMRQIVSASVNYGFRRPDDKLIAMNNYNGVRALYVNNIRGNRTYVLNFENDFYANFKVLGFSSALFAFADLALTQQKSYRGGQFDQAVGLGIRLRNLSLGIGYFEVSFVYYPHLDIPGFKPYTVTGTTDLTRGINPDNLFVAGGLSPDN